MSPDLTPADAAAHFARRLAFETDPSDVYAELATGSPSFVFIDTRSQEAWDQGHARGAVHMPKPLMPERIPTYPAGTRFVVYCWGPGCNGATRAGLIISELGYPVREMIGGFEYWAREGLPVDRVSTAADGSTSVEDATLAPDPLTAPSASASDGVQWAGAGRRGVDPGARPIACDC